MKEKFFVISRCEDEPHFTVMDREALDKYLNDEEDGVGGYKIIEDAKSVDLEYFPASSVLIIKGEVIVPRAKEKVVRYEF